TQPTTCCGLGVGANRLPTSPGPTRCTSSCGTSSTNGHPTRPRAATQLAARRVPLTPPSKQPSKPPLNHRGDQQRRKGQNESYQEDYPEEIPRQGVVAGKCRGHVHTHRHCRHRRY